MDDDFVVLDLLGALVRKSLLIVDRGSERTRYSMLETIRQFAEEQLAMRGEADDARSAHARYFAARHTHLLELWDSPRQRDAYDWFTVELANLRNAFRWAADVGDLDTAATIATYAGFLGLAVATYEPLGWAEELVEPATAVNHAQLGALCAMASQCWMNGRLDDGVRFAARAIHALNEGGTSDAPYGIDGLIGGAYVTGGLPVPAVDWYSSQLERGRDPYTLNRVGLTLALLIAGRSDEAVEMAGGIVDAAEATRNPYALSHALFTAAFAFSDNNPGSAIAASRRGLDIARETGNRANESHLLATLSRLRGQGRDPMAAFDYLTLAIRKYHDAGNTTNIRHTFAILATLLHRVGRDEPAATILGVGATPFVVAAFPETELAITQLKAALGDSVYERLAPAGLAMPNATMVTYAYEQIDQARAELANR